MQKFGFALIIVVCALFLWALVSYPYYHNKEVGLRNEYKAQESKAMVQFDAMWKIIAQQTQVKDDYRDSFYKLCVDVMDERYGGDRGQALMKWIQESQPGYSDKLHTKLMTSIESLRTGFAREQNKLADIKREHDDIRQHLPGSIFIGGRPELELKLVTSAKTKEAVRNGEENDIDLSPRKDR